ncbi:hypothetical protein AVEN_162756-1 [Araneus ventricosus]|uniref:Uncharacterized protein n=1 Tax=Araneus ventricosus TaxID=182803 RepID=A0A4Y2VUQ2_ARAVE|nr:hypothetical protein AVEN_162756-1 [Araneus ventricosus]
MNVKFSANRFRGVFDHTLKCVFNDFGVVQGQRRNTCETLRGLIKLAAFADQLFARDINNLCLCLQLGELAVVETEGFCQRFILHCISKIGVVSGRRPLMTKQDVISFHMIYKMWKPSQSIGLGDSVRRFPIENAQWRNSFSISFENGGWLVQSTMHNKY